MKKVLVCGSQDWRDVATVARRLGELPEDTIVITGGADGADKLAMFAAAQRGLHVATVYPLWQHFGKSAGHRRNAAMLALEPDQVIAFSHGSAGTQGTIDGARRKGLPVEVIGREAQK